MAESESLHSIGNANTLAWKSLLKQKWVYAAFCLAALFFLGSFLVYPWDGGTPAGFIYGAMFLLPVLMAWSWERGKVIRAFMKRFAESQRYDFLDYAGKTEVSKLRGSLFDRGTDRGMKNIISGRYKEHALRIFNYHFTVPMDGKSNRTVYSTVFELTFETNLPNIFLVDKSLFTREFDIRSSKENLAFSSHPKEISIPGGIDDFRLYVPEDYEAEALQIFGPDILGSFTSARKSLSSFSIEMTDDKMYIYVPGEIAEPLRVKALYELAQMLVEKIGPLVRKMKPALDAQEEVFTRLNKI